MSVGLSVVIPVFNCENFIIECVESVLSVNDEGVEVLVVNDGSTDKTLAMLSRINDKRLQIYNQANSGVSRARNKGIELATGKYIMFVDADDALDTSWGSHVLPLLNTTFDIAVFGRDINRQYYSKEEIIRSISAVEGCSDLKWMASPCSKLYRREFIENSKVRFNPGIIHGEDALFNLELAIKATSLNFISESFYRYRIHSDSATRTFDSRFFQSNEIYLRKMEEILIEFCHNDAFVRELVDASFCKSVKIALTRIARIESRFERRFAIEAMRNDPFSTRLRETSAERGLAKDEAFIYQLVKHHILEATVFFVRIILLRHSDSSCKWVIL